MRHPGRASYRESHFPSAGKISPLPTANAENREIRRSRASPGTCPEFPFRLFPHVTEEIAVAADFTGRTALITGAGRGIGRAIALGLGGAGARVMLLARTAEQLDETRDLLRERDVPAARISVLPADLADEEQRAMAAAAVLTAGRVDILVNNAATVEPLGPTIGIAAADLRLA
jgi:hypothetical protein